MSTYLDYLLSREIYDDTKPVVDEKLVAEARRARDTLADYRKGGINQAVLSQWRAALRARSDALAGAQRMAAQINAAATQASIANTQAYVGLLKSNYDNLVRLQSDGNDYMSTRASPALQAYTAANGGNAGLTNGMSELVNLYESSGMSLNMNSPDMASLGQVVATRMFGSSLANLTPEAARDRVFAASNNPTLAAKTYEFMAAAQSAYNAQTQTIASVQDSIRNAEDAMKAGSPLSADEMKRGAQSALGAVQAMAGGSATDLRTEMERVASLDSTYAYLQQEAERLQQLAVQPGQEGLRTKIGRAIANPEFQAWAAENGFKIGEATIDPNTGEVRYIPGVQDERAILAFRRQAITGKPLGLMPSSTGQRVRVTAVDPEKRDQIVRDYNLGDGRYAVTDDGTVLSPLQYETELYQGGFAPTGIKVATTADGKVFATTVTANYVFDDGKFRELDADKNEALPEGLTFEPGLVSLGDDKFRYMTSRDLLTLGDPNAILTPDEGDEAKIRDFAPIKLVTAEELPAVGEVSFIGYLDKANAKDILTKGEGTFSINGGEHVFTKGAKVEVLGTNESTFLRDREKAAERRTEKGPELLDATAVRMAAARAPAAAPPPVMREQLTPLGELAVADEPFAAPRGQMLAQGGLLTEPVPTAALEAPPAGTAPAAPAATAPAAPAAAAAGAPAAGAPAAAPPAAAAPAAAPATAPATAPAAPKVTYAKTSNGAVYRKDETTGAITMIQAPPGQVLPAEELRTTGRGDSREYGALDRQFKSGEPLAAAEAGRLERQYLGTGQTVQPEKPAYEVTTERTGPVINYPELPKERIELFKKLRERISEARAKREDEAAMGGEAAPPPEPEGVRPPGPPPAGSAAASTGRVPAASTFGRGKTYKQAPLDIPLPDESGQLAPPTAAQRAETKRKAVKQQKPAVTQELYRTGYATTGLGGANVGGAREEEETPTLAPPRAKGGELSTREARRESRDRLAALRKAQRAAQAERTAANGGAE